MSLRGARLFVVDRGSLTQFLPAETPPTREASFADAASSSPHASTHAAFDALPGASWMDRLRGRFGERAGGIALTLLIEGLLVLALLTFGPRVMEPQRKVADMTTVLDIAAPPAPEPESPAPETAADEPLADPDAAPPPSEPAPARPAPPVPPSKAAPPSAVTPPQVQVTKAPAMITLSPNQMAAADLNNMPAKAAPSASAAPKPMMGPVGGPRRGDTERVGTAKNGQPLYAAAWYREPTDAELRGYLSTVGEPGWATIECRTVADFRVEDCKGLDQSPERSNMLQAVLAAAWQFRVRPPRVGGQSQVGAWVRIRIIYS